ncbi:hypothetical protein [Glycomyces tritici]|uniref:Uncharacterized protein n=1 Tax=Glycomyces tritici TaxID=2665176 RepID=A0ABT7YVD7_9ACTN|nr:hypothetical protein [Glycomyces tritici]MDN3242579.1 hypothetical protein [Glycomyces tritici]
MTAYTTQDQTQLLAVITPAEPTFAEQPQRAVVPPAQGLIGAFDYGHHRYLVYRQGDRNVWVYMHPWRREHARQPVGAVLDLVTPKQHAVFSQVESERELVFDPDWHEAVTVEEVAAAFWSDAR